jgi:hypothetical protein
MGDTFWLRSTPPVILPVRSLETDLKTLVGPFLSEPWLGEHPSASGCPQLRPSGVAHVPAPWGTLAEIDEVPA